MAIPIKNNNQIEKMRKAGEVVAKAHELIAQHIKPGITTNELDKIVSEYFQSCGATANFLNYNGYPNTICVSINDVVIHGIPSEQKIEDGDLVSIDLGAIVEGWHGDAARTHLVGNVSDEARSLEKVTRESFFIGIEYAKSGNHLHEISKAIQDYVESHGYSVVRDYVGHGIGRALHEAPQIPHYMPVGGGRGARLHRGMTLAVEPMVNQGDYAVELLDDGWTVVTLDGTLSAHYENTILITDGEPEILTLR